jgi:hypothetical protein
MWFFILEKLLSVFFFNWNERITQNLFFTLFSATLDQKYVKFESKLHKQSVYSLRNIRNTANVGRFLKNR